MNSQDIFSKRVKSQRLAKGISQAALGSAVGLSKQAINDIEHGRYKTTIDKLNMFAKFFEVPVDFLVGNGIYENWEEIMEHKQEVFEIMSQHPDIEMEALNRITEKGLIRLVGIIFSKIVIDGNDISFYLVESFFHEESPE